MISLMCRKMGKSLRFRQHKREKEREDEHIDPLIKYCKCL